MVWAPLPKIMGTDEFRTALIPWAGSFWNLNSHFLKSGEYFTLFSKFPWFLIYFSFYAVFVFNSPGNDIKRPCPWPWPLTAVWRLTGNKLFLLSLFFRHDSCEWKTDLELGGRGTGDWGQKITEGNISWADEK